MSRVFSFDECKNGAPLIVNSVYYGGPNGDASSDPLMKLIPNCPAGSGIRVKKREDGSGLPAYIVLWSNGKISVWPDRHDAETGILHYYGDNKDPSKKAADTRGNQALMQVFRLLHQGFWSEVPPIFMFRRSGTEKRHRLFVGLVVPGNPHIPAGNDLVQTVFPDGAGRFFENLEADFTVLDTRDEPIERSWIEKLITDHHAALVTAPRAWKEFTAAGLSAIRPLQQKWSSEEQLLVQDLQQHLSNQSHKGLPPQAEQLALMLSRDSRDVGEQLKALTPDATEKPQPFYTKEVSIKIDEAAARLGVPLEVLYPDVSKDLPTDVTERTAIVKVRVGQSRFRLNVLGAYQNACAITGLRDPDLLEAAHINPWSESEDSRLDPSNGIALIPTLHRAYDKNKLGITPDGVCVVSNALHSACLNDSLAQRFYNAIDGQSLATPVYARPNRDFLAERFNAFCKIHHLRASNYM